MRCSAPSKAMRSGVGSPRLLALAATTTGPPTGSVHAHSGTLMPAPTSALDVLYSEAEQRARRRTGLLRRHTGVGLTDCPDRRSETWTTGSARFRVHGTSIPDRLIKVSLVKKAPGGKPPGVFRFASIIEFKNSRASCSARQNLRCARSRRLPPTAAHGPDRAPRSSPASARRARIASTVAGDRMSELAPRITISGLCA